MNSSPYETERLILSPASLEDASFFLELMNSPKWIANIGNRNLKTVEETAAYIEQKMLPQLKEKGFSNYTISLKETGAKVGSVGLFDRPGLEGVDIGYSLLPQYEKNGYAFEAAEKMKKLAFEEFELVFIQAITLPSNQASKKLLEKLNMKFVQYIYLPNDDAQLMLYRLEKNEE